MQKTMLAAERDGGNACRPWDFAEPAITECGVLYASHSCHAALVDVRRTSSAAVREVITKRRKTLLPVCKLLCWEGPHSDSSRLLQHLAVSFPGTSKPFSKDALLKVNTGTRAPDVARRHKLLLWVALSPSPETAGLSEKDGKRA